MGCIVLVLVGLAIITSEEMRERRRGDICASHLRRLNEAFRTYAANWDGAFPRNAPRTRAHHGQEDPWPELLTYYLGNRRALRCPDDPSRIPFRFDAPPLAGHITSYPMNSVIGWSWPETHGFEIALNYSDITIPGQTLLLTDREPWHFRQSGKQTYRLALFVDGHVQICRTEMYLRLWGRLTPS